MRCTSRRRQSGQSLVEAVVASLVVGVAVVAGLGTLNATVIGARQVAVQAWAECMQRGEVEAVLAAPWSTGYPAPAGVGVQVTAIATGAQAAEKITVTVSNPVTGGTIARVLPVTFYKAFVLAPAGPGTFDPNTIAGGCRPLLGGQA